MKEEISDYYKKKGYCTAYISPRNGNRRIATLRKPNGEMRMMSYARYVYTSHYQVDVPEDCHVDHINGDKTDDRIENLQIISKGYNIRKDHRKKEMIVCICPVCKEEFLFPKRNLSTHPNPCCSRHCGGIKSHWKRQPDPGLN